MFYKLGDLCTICQFVRRSLMPPWHSQSYDLRDMFFCFDTAAVVVAIAAVIFAGAVVACFMWKKKGIECM